VFLGGVVTSIGLGKMVMIALDVGGHVAEGSA